MITKPAMLPAEKIHDIIQNRWSPRAFDVSRPVADAAVQALLEAARWAPSCMNEQPWRFLVCNKATHEAAWQNVVGLFGREKSTVGCQRAGFVVAVAMNTFNQNQKSNRWAAYDTGAASLNRMLAGYCHGTGDAPDGRF
jgi:nitroreductase